MFANYGTVGYYKDDSNDMLMTFELEENAKSSIDMNNFSNVPLTSIVYNVGGLNVLLKGSNNMLPDEIESILGANRLLPEVIEKQKKILFGKGLHVYKLIKDKGRILRDWDIDTPINKWLDSWQVNGLHDSANDTAMKIIDDFYYFEDFFVKWRFFKTRVISGNMPIAGIEHIEDKRCRLGTSLDPTSVGYDFEDKDFQHIIVGNWTMATQRFFKVYPRFDMSNPLKNQIAISYHKNNTPGKIYGINKFYAGLKDWLVGTNRNPQYINSYLENSLNAKVHVQIPSTWVQSIEDKIERYCEENETRKEEGKELITLFDGDLIIGTEYSVSLRDKYIKLELRNLSKFLTGVKNQGKLYASISYLTQDGIAEWKILPIDLKYKEFIGALIDYDKRADDVILSSKGLDASISNVSKDGVISKSGSDLYYNYLIYLHNLTIPENICMQPFNTAIRINFPELYNQGYRIGFLNEVPARQEDTSPNDRLQNTVSQAAQKTSAEISELKQIIMQLQKTQ